MARLVQDSRGIGADVLTVLAAAVYFLGFFGAVHTAMGKVIY
jgi:hypothetical protein